MQVNYVSDNTGATIAVQIPIKDWETIKNKYHGIEVQETELPQWQKDMIDKRLWVIEQDPSSILDIQELFYELDKDISL